MTEMLYRLQMLAGPRAGQLIALSGPRMTIGRYPLAEIALDDPQVAYRHAVLTRAGDGWRLADLSSETGTTVNGVRVSSEPVDLGPGDLIVLGESVSMIYETAAPPDADPPPAELETEAVLTDAVLEERTSGESWVGEYDPPPLEPEVVAAVSPSRPPEPARAAPAAEPARRKTGRVWWIAAGCLALALLLVGCCAVAAFMYYVGGDWLLYQMGYLP